MSREIKFRAWDSDQKRMLKVYRISFDGPIESAQAHCYLDDRGAEGSKKCFYDGDGLTLEQFTGLKDKNGKDIYEGDIVCVYDVYADVGYVDTVIWGGEDDYPAFDLKNHAMKYEANALSSIVNGGFETIEVIGNIHKNPELLEADK